MPAVEEDLHTQVQEEPAVMAVAELVVLAEAQTAQQELPTLAEVEVQVEDLILVVPMVAVAWS